VPQAYWRWSLTIVVLLATMSCDRPAPAGQGPRVTMDAQFDALWWSTAQMDGLDPNAPPPKTTRVRLSAWEYTDPIGVPHPDTVDVAVTLGRTVQGGLERLELEVAVEWQIGPRSSSQGLTWQRGIVRVIPVEFADGNSTVIRVPIDIAARIGALEPIGQWPWSMAVSLVLRTSSGTVIARRRLELPIRPGD
jgi:hypothetical protein